MIQYGNEARKHYGEEVRRSVRFFEEEWGLILHLGIPGGQWLKVTPNEAREMGKFRRRRVDQAMKKTLMESQSLDDSLLLREAAAKAFAPLPAMVTGANAVPITSTPIRSSAPSVAVDPDDVQMSEGTSAAAAGFQ